MGDFRSGVWVGLVLALVAALSGCGSSKATQATSFPTPANIILSPSPQASIDLGANIVFTAIAEDKNKTPIIVPLHFISSNTAVVTIASNGRACAGTWDSLTNPQICTAGPVGVAQITAEAHGVSSPPTTVYVHQHVDNITVAPVTQPTDACFSKDVTWDYAATAFSHGLDITATVGAFTWQALDPIVVSLSTTASGLLLNQAETTAAAPGVTGIYASVSSVTSLPLPFETCRVESISLALEGGGGTSFNVPTGTSQTITATVVDSLGVTIIPTLTWSSSNPAVASISSEGSVSTLEPGGSTFIATCTPPTCNAGILPSLPIYPAGVITGIVTGTSSSPVVWVTSDQCGLTDGCVTTIVPIVGPNNLLGFAINLPATPNSLVFGPQGTQAYLGTDRSLLGTKGLMVFNPSAVPPAPVLTQINSVTGKVLAVSSDGKKVVVSHTDPSEPPDQVFILDTSTNASTALAISGATAADFSPDGFKAYIVAGSTLYVYSTVDALQAVPLSAPANDVSFLSEGAFAYLAGGDPAGAIVYRTCDNTIATDSTLPNPVPQILNTPAIPIFIKTLGDATKVLAVDSPGIDIITVNSLDATGCSVGTPPTIPPMPNVSNTVSSFNLGQGSFTPKQFIVSSDNRKAYIVASDLPSILVYNIGSQISSGILLAGNALPVQASLTSDGSLLYVAADDGMVHVVDTVINSDIQQVPFPPTFFIPQGGLCSGVDFVCNPNLIAVTP